MARMDPLRGQTVGVAEGEVLEIGFCTGRNLEFYDADRVSVVRGLDPMLTEGVRRVDKRINAAPFPVERYALEANHTLPFDEGRFDCVVTTWTLCSIPDASAALAEMRRVLKPKGRYVFIEHGRSPKPGVARWQDRVNPIWNKLTDGCNINRPIATIVGDAGFEFESIREFKVTGPSITSYMYSGVATPNRREGSTRATLPGVGAVSRALSLAWEAPQTVLGVAMLGAEAARRRIVKLEVEDGRLVVESKGTGISLGYVVFWSRENNRWHDLDLRNRAHELGHTKQSRLLGPLYLPVVGLPSISRAAYALAYRELTGKPWTGYYDGYPERWADRLGGVRRDKGRL